jgi:NhaA family Na+:H+ antiporter
MLSEKHPIKNQFFYPWEQKLERLITPFEVFIHRQTTSGIMLMAVSVLALAVENSPLREGYEHLIHMPLSITLGTWTLERSLVHWINEGLMAFFFFVVGLEIKREVLVGELSAPRQAALPIIAAIGGMVVPAFIYFLFNQTEPWSRGWGIPMATDIAFCVGALVMLGNRVPKALMIFLVSLAIVDDLGAVVVIAVFYTEKITIPALGIAAAILFVLITFNRSGVRKSLPYLVAGICLWFALFYSGIHSTIAGVLVAFCIPSKARYKTFLLADRVKTLVRRFEACSRPRESILTNSEQHAVLRGLNQEIGLAEAPLQRMEDALHLPVALGVIPLFAFANAGIRIDMSSLASVLSSPISLGVICGLVLGKFIGITGSAWLALRLGIGSLSQGINLQHLAGVGLLGGIGFTMSIFVAELSFPGNPEGLHMAKSGILLASLLAGVLGFIWLRFFVKKTA